MYSPKKHILAVKNAKKIKSILMLLIYFTVEAYNSYLRYVAQKRQDEMKETYLKSCNSSLKDETRKENVPKWCYYQMKWRKEKNLKTLAQNKKAISGLGTGDFRAFSQQIFGGYLTFMFTN